MRVSDERIRNLYGCLSGGLWCPQTHDFEQSRCSFLMTQGNFWGGISLLLVKYVIYFFCPYRRWHQELPDTCEEAITQRKTSLGPRTIDFYQNRHFFWIIVSPTVIDRFIQKDLAFANIHIRATVLLVAVWRSRTLHRLEILFFKVRITAIHHPTSVWKIFLLILLINQVRGWPSNLL